jgi:hypothetical protein
MGILDLWHDIGVVEELNDAWLCKPALFPREKAEDVAWRSAYMRELLIKARGVFGRHERTEREECEKCVTELLQFRRALALTDVQNPQLREQEGYEHAYDRTTAALQHIATTVRLHFLLLDLQAVVADA